MDIPFDETEYVTPARRSAVHGGRCDFDQKIAWKVFGEDPLSRIYSRVSTRGYTNVTRDKDQTCSTGWMDPGIVNRLEAERPEGLTSAEILEVFARHGVAMSEATLRKYVQVGLLPRSIRVGRKGKHRGSQGVYPVSVIRQILRIKEMMAADYTIEQIKRDVFFMRSDIQQLESTLDGIFSTLSRVLGERRRESYARAVTRDVDDARALSRELLCRLGAIESKLTTRARLHHVSAS